MPDETEMPIKIKLAGVFSSANGVLMGWTEEGHLYVLDASRAWQAFGGFKVKPLPKDED